MKGAPERVILRCNKIMMKGVEVDFNETYLKEVNAANEALGKLGERVLALAICKLDPNNFSKVPAYPFDCESWK